jgi:hypothetical protein
MKITWAGTREEKRVDSVLAAGLSAAARHGADVPPLLHNLTLIPLFFIIVFFRESAQLYYETIGAKSPITS